MPIGADGLIRVLAIGVGATLEAAAPVIAVATEGRITSAADIPFEQTRPTLAILTLTVGPVAVVAVATGHAVEP